MIGTSLGQEHSMTHEFKVDDMTCGHCVSRITKSLHTFDRAATVAIDLASRTVAVDGAADRSDYAFVIRDAGYTPR
jgi:copper chaperone